MKTSLSLKIIISMASVVVLTALTSCIVSLMIITNQTHAFEKRLDQLKTQPQQPAVTEEQISKVKSVVNNDSLTTIEQYDQIGQILHPPPFDIDIIRVAAVDSGLPMSAKPIDSAPPDQRTFHPGDPNSFDSFINNPMYRSILVATIISIVFAVGLGILLSRTVIKPLKAMEKASESIADGNYTLELKPEGKSDLGRLAASFNKMSRALRQTEQKRKELVANLSHEFGTPLSSIQGYTEALRDGLVQNPERRDKIYDHILREVNFLTGMVDSMRQWTKSEKSLEELSLTNFEVVPLIHGIAHRFEAIAQKKEIQLDLDLSIPSPVVYADLDSLTHILGNLVDNALRYTPAGGLVIISAKTLPRQNRVLFEVSDTGVGIGPEHLPYVFERFYRVDKSRDRATGGTGLGLSIVREAVLAQGGEIKIESAVGVGTKVKFYLHAASNKRIEKREKLALKAVG